MARWAFTSVCASLVALGEDRRPLSNDVPSGGFLGSPSSICTAVSGRFTVLELLLLALTFVRRTEKIIHTIGCVWNLRWAGRNR